MKNSDKEAGDDKAMAEHAPWVIEEVYQLLVEITRKANQEDAKAVIEELYRLRVVGIPKRNSEDSRPIAVASVWVRIWHRLLLESLPQAPAEQWSERGVIAATASWLAAKFAPCSFKMAFSLASRLARAFDSSSSLADSSA